MEVSRNGVVRPSVSPEGPISTDYTNVVKDPNLAEIISLLRVTDVPILGRNIRGQHHAGPWPVERNGVRWFFCVE